MLMANPDTETKLQRVIKYTQKGAHKTKYLPHGVWFHLSIGKRSTIDGSVMRAWNLTPTRCRASEGKTSIVKGKLGNMKSEVAEDQPTSSVRFPLFPQRILSFWITATNIKINCGHEWDALITAEPWTSHLHHGNTASSRTLDPLRWVHRY